MKPPPSAPAQQNAGPSILAVAYGGGHIAMMLPVLRALRTRRPDINITLLALTTAARVARNAGETPLGYADLLHLLSYEEQAQALALGRALRPGNTHPDIAEAETVAYLGINAWDLQQQLGPQAAQARLSALGRHGFYPLHFFRRVLKSLRPDLVLATNSPRSEQAVVDAATEAGIPSLAMLDLFGVGAPPPEVRERTSPPEGDQKPRGGPSAFIGDAFAARTRYPSRVCVLSDVVRDNLIRAGWPPERIAVTGNPAFDALNTPQARERGAALRASLADAGQRLILLAMQPEPLHHPASPGQRGDPHLPERVLQGCIDAVRQHPNWILIVRPHPSQGNAGPPQVSLHPTGGESASRPWESLPPAPALPDDPQLRLSPSSEPLHPLLHAVDAVITGTSTVGLEAHLAGARVLQLLDSIAAPAMPYLALGVAGAACHLADLPQTLAALLAQPDSARATSNAGPAARPPQGRASPLGGQRGQSPSVGAHETAADQVSEQALALLAAHSSTAC